MTNPVSATAPAGGDGVVAARHLARWLALWLALAATPTFAIMAVLTAMTGGGPADLLCAAGQGSLLDGMVPMYLLMSAFHASAWLRLIAERRGRRLSESRQQRERSRHHRGPRRSDFVRIVR